jgi:chromosome segregation ATPase
MQASTQPRPVTPAAEAPTAPAAPVTITTVGVDGKTQTLTIPKTAEEVQELRAHRDELSTQLTSVTSRRNSLSEQIRSAPEGASRTGLEARIRLLDQRILQLETDIAATGRQLSAAPADLLDYTESRPSGGDDFAEGMAAGTVPLLLLLGIVAGYRRFRRRRAPKVRGAPANLLTESAQRLERVENAIEAIALEVERVGEGQRFVTRLLSEQAPLAQRIPQPAAERQHVDHGNV